MSDSSNMTTWPSMTIAGYLTTPKRLADSRAVTASTALALLSWLHALDAVSCDVSRFGLVVREISGEQLL